MKLIAEIQHPTHLRVWYTIDGIEFCSTFKDIEAYNSFSFNESKRKFVAYIKHEKIDADAYAKESQK